MNLLNKRSNINKLLVNISNWPENRKGLYFTFCFSAFLKVIVLIFLFNKAINIDGILYISAAEKFVQGYFQEGFAIYPMPFYSLILTAVHFIIPDWVIAARLISYTTLVLTIIPVYLLTEHIFNRKAAFWASFAFALAPVTNGWVMNVTRGPVFILFFIWAVYYSIQAISFAQKRYFILLCVFSWLAVLCRIEGIIIIPFCLIFFLYMALREQQERTPLIIGVIICLAFPLLFYAFGSIILGHQAVSMNRISMVWKYVNDFYHLKFMDNYNNIYYFLKAAENSPPFSGWNQNFAAISRHYIPFIYLLGLLEMLIKVIFPLFIIPFFYGIKKSFSRAHLFIAWLVGSYLLMVYYHQFVNDYASKRFVFAPAVLLFPWIGKGMESIFNRVKTSRQNLIITLILVCFIAFPLGKLFNTFIKEDKVIVTAGKWLAGKQEFRDVRLMTTDPRIPFYAGRDAFSSRNKNFWFPKNKTESYLDMEKEAISSQAKLMIIRTKKRKKDTIPEFNNFQLIKEFIGTKKYAAVYGTADLAMKLTDN